MSELILYTEVYVQKRWEFKQLLKHHVGMERYYVMRGQANSEWDIASRLERNVCNECMKECEDFMINKCNTHPKLKTSSRNEMLAKLQHYGGTTIMVDFTHSFKNALYFGIRNLLNKHDIDDFAVWLVLVGDLTHNPKISFLPLWRIDSEGAEGEYQAELDQFQYRNYLLFDNELPYDVVKKRYEEYIKDYPEFLNKHQIAGLDIMTEKEDEFERMKSAQREREGERFETVNFEQFKKNEKEKMEWLKTNYPFIIRMVIQEGLFLFSTNYNHSFMENLFLTTKLSELAPEEVEPYNISGAIGNGFSKVRRVIKITFNYKLRKYIRNYLEKENITEESLFPKEEGIDKLEIYVTNLFKDYLNQKSKK